MKTYFIASCGTCQGQLGLYKSVNDGKYFVICNDCEIVWTDPAEAVNNIGGQRVDVGRCIPVTIDEIQGLWWYQFVSDFEAEIQDAKQRMAAKRAVTQNGKADVPFQRVFPRAEAHRAAV